MIKEFITVLSGYMYNGNIVRVGYTIGWNGTPFWGIRVENGRSGVTIAEREMFEENCRDLFNRLTSSSSEPKYADYLVKEFFI